MFQYLFNPKERIEKSFWLKEDNKEELRKINYGTLKRLVVILNFISIVLLVVTFTVAEYSVMRMPYILFFVFICAVQLVVYKIKASPTGVLIGLYGLFGVLFLFTFYLSVVVSPDSRATIFLGTIAITPILIADKSWRVNSFVCLFFLIHTVLAILFKTGTLAMDDFANCGSFLLLGIFVGESARRTKIRNLVLYKKTLELADIDFLTGLYNRRKMYEYIIRSEQKTSEIQGVLLLDIDLFKGYNDNYGHQAGDDCLCKVGNFLAAFGKENDMVFFRFGGEEFIGFYYGEDRKKLSEAAKRLKEEFSKMQIPYPHYELGYVTASIGYVEQEPQSPYSIEKMISCADEALYRAKASGRNCSVVFLPQYLDAKV